MQVNITTKYHCISFWLTKISLIKYYMGGVLYPHGILYIANENENLSKHFGK